MSPPHRLLIVDDEEEVRILLSEHFEMRGYVVAAAADAAEAIELLDTQPRPCAAFVDLLMPGIVGHELLEYMHAEVPDIPVAIVTASPQLAPKGYTVFGKPFATKQLIEFVLSSCKLEHRSHPSTR